MANVIEINCTTGEVIERDFTDEEKTQHALDLITWREREAAETAEQTRIQGLKASIALKRQATTWQPFTEEEVAYLNSVNQ